MRVAVVMKTASGAAFDAVDAHWREARVLPGVMSPYDAHAVEAAVRLRETGVAVEIVIVSMAGSEVLGALRDALAMGADRAVLLTDPALKGGDIQSRSRVMAAMLGSVDPDLVLYCPWSGDIDGSLLFGATAARLGKPVIAQARSLGVSESVVRCVRQVEEGDQQLTATLPCFVELTETINKPRYATIKGKQAARAKPVRAITLADLALEPSDAAAGTKSLSAVPAPSRAQPQVIEYSATCAADILAFLRQRDLLE